MQKPSFWFCFVFLSICRPHLSKLHQTNNRDKYYSNYTSNPVQKWVYSLCLIDKRYLEILMRNQNQNLRRELRKTGDTMCSPKTGIRSRYSERKRPLSFLLHLVTFLSHSRTDGKEGSHEKTGKKTIPQLPWSAGEGGWLQEDTKPCSLCFPWSKTSPQSEITPPALALHLHQ